MFGKEMVTVLGLIVGVLVLGLLVVAPKAAAANGTTWEVVIEGMKFKVDGKEQPLTIKVGDSVVFVNKDRMKHNAKSTDGKTFKTELIPPGGRSRPITFSQVGTIRFRCGPHPSMKGSIIVK